MKTLKDFFFNKNFHIINKLNIYLNKENFFFMIFESILLFFIGIFSIFIIYYINYKIEFSKLKA
jgi:hypothetical protein